MCDHGGRNGFLNRFRAGICSTCARCRQNRRTFRWLLSSLLNPVPVCPSHYKGSFPRGKLPFFVVLPVGCQLAAGLIGNEDVRIEVLTITF